MTLFLIVLAIVEHVHVVFRKFNHRRRARRVALWRRRHGMTSDPGIGGKGSPKPRA